MITNVKYNTDYEIMQELFTDISEICNITEESCEKFIQKVESGRAKSKETYSDLLKVREKIKSLRFKLKEYGLRLE